MENALAHHLLLAMPMLEDAYFARSVVYIVQHDDNGAIGVVINKPVAMGLPQILSNMKITPQVSLESPAMQKEISFGGPVMRERGFVLHGDDRQWDATFANDNWGLTTSRDILEAIAQGAGPEAFQICLGYAGWSEGQLEQEMASDAWLAIPATYDLVFGTAPYDRYQKAFDSLGVDPNQLSPGGTA